MRSILSKGLLVLALAPGWTLLAQQPAAPAPLPGVNAPSAAAAAAASPANANSGAAASHDNVSINAISPNATGLENARIFVPGSINTPGHWDIRGDGSGPTLVNGEIILPNTLFNSSIYGTNGGTGSQRFPSSDELLKQVEAEQLARPEAPPPPPPPIQLRDMSRFTPELLLDQADSRDLSTRASALTALGDVAGPPFLKLLAVKKLMLALDDDDLRIVKLSVLALGKLNSDSATNKIVALLNLEDKELLIIASKTLGQMGKRKALPQLQSLANLPDPEISEAAAAAIDQIEKFGSQPFGAATPTTAQAPAKTR